MAHFRGTIRGSRGEASRLGGKPSGMAANINGWTSGIHVEATHDEDAKHDVFRVYISGGSLGAFGRCALTVRKPENADAIVQHHDQDTLATARIAELETALSKLIHSLDFRSKRDRDAARREAQNALDH